MVHNTRFDEYVSTCTCKQPFPHAHKFSLDGPILDDWTLLSQSKTQANHEIHGNYILHPYACSNGQTTPMKEH